MSRKKSSGEVPPAPPAPPPPVSADSGSELFWESKVAESLGVARERIVALRVERLTEGPHFRIVRNAVVLTASGLEIIASALRPESSPSATVASPAPPALGVQDGPAPRVMMVVRRVPPNIRVLLCSPAGSQIERVVRVRDNRLFTPGMVLEAINGGTNGLQFTGRLPRRKGRW
jgi:hypothetical protein